MMTRLAVPLFAAILVASAFALVTSQYRSRELFARIELARQETRNLTADAAQLRVALGRASQPAAVAAGAQRLGMRPISPGDVVLLPREGQGGRRGESAESGGASRGEGP